MGSPPFRSIPACYALSMIDLDQAGAGLSSARVVRETGALADIVEHYWIERPTAVAAGDLRSWRIVPDPAGHLLLHLYRDGDRGTRSGGLRLVGARSVFADTDKRNRVATIGARLRPGALATIAGIPAIELTDRSVGLSRLVGGLADDVENRLARAVIPRPAGAVAALRAGIAEMAAKAPAAAPCATAAARILDRHAGRIRAREIADHLGFARRTLRQAMRDNVGIGAKRYARIRRAHRVIRAAQSSHRPWVELALDSGYADQPHLVRDFTALLGESPARFLRRAAA